MKKHKILFAVISALLAVGMIFAAACGGGYSETQNDDKQALLDLVVDFGNAKSKYNLGEELDTSRLFCSAKFIDVETGEESVDEDIEDDIIIDSSEFDSSVVGIYSIYVSYTHAGVTRVKSYPVQVIGTDAEFGGIEVEYAAGTNNKVTLQSGTTTTTIPQDGIIVKRVDNNGNVMDTLPSSDYVLELYKGTVKQDGWTVGGGAYTIRATLKSNPKVSNFVSYYVVDDLKTFTLNAGAVTEQKVGDDVMSSTWTFTATYNSGAARIVTADDVTITNLITTRVTTNTAVGYRVATVTYTEFSGRGGTVSKELKIQYVVTE
ncbi:MAG: hypothetical protein K2L67_04710 [Clostridia bacterium]|nr:hypothetical protein [Clostridia bacterium]